MVRDSVWFCYLFVPTKRYVRGHRPVGCLVVVVVESLRGNSTEELNHPLRAKVIGVSNSPLDYHHFRSFESLAICDALLQGHFPSLRNRNARFETIFVFNPFL